MHVCRLQKIVVEALERPEKDVTLMARFFAEIFTRVTVVVSCDCSLSAHTFTIRKPRACGRT